jgi:putative DNA primase/helicase
VFTEDERHQVRAVPVLDIAERHGARLKKSGRERVGPCLVCGGHDRFAIHLDKNIWNCRGCGKGGDAIDLEMHLTGCSFVEAVETLTGESKSTTTAKQTPREPTPEELAAKAAERRRQQFIEATTAQIIAGIVPVRDTLAERYLSDQRRIDVEKIRDVLERIDAIGFHPAVYLNEPGHPLHGHFLPAIVAIQTDPVTAARTSGISRTYLDKDGRKLIGLDGKSMRAKSLGPPGVVHLSRDEDVLGGLHLCEGLESALSAMMTGFCPMWATGSTSQMAALPVLDGIECLTVVADNDDAGLKAARETCQRWADAGREARVQTLIEPGDINDAVRRIS